MKSVLFTLAVLIIASTCNARGLKVPTKVSNRIGTCATIGFGLSIKHQTNQTKRQKEEQARIMLETWTWRRSLSSKEGRAATSTNVIRQFNLTNWRALVSPFVFRKFPTVDKSTLTNLTDTTYESPACESSTYCIPQASEMDKTMMRMIDFLFSEMDKELIETVQKEDIESIHTVVPMTLKQKE